MKRLVAHESLAYVGHLKNLLEQAGILCLIKNAQLSGGLGEIPFLDCLPELWVLRDEQLEEARAVIQASQTADSSRGEWRCGQCGEANEGQFGACWKCGAADDSQN